MVNPVEPTDGDERRRASWPSSIRCRHGKACRPATSSACSSAAGASSAASSPRSACRTSRRDPEARRAGPARHPPVQSRAGHRLRASRCRSSTSPRRASTIRTCGSSAPTTSRATTAPRAAPAATWSMRTTATRCTRDLRAASATTGTDADGRPDHPARRRAGHPLTPRLHARDPVVAVHGLPHAPAEHVRELAIYGYTMWDYEADAPFMWPEKQKYPTDAERVEILERNPEEAAIRGKWGDLEFLKDVVDAQSEAQGHAVRRLPRPRLELPRGLQARPQGHAARQGRQGGRRRATPTKFKKARAPVVDPHRHRHALRRLPLRAGRPRQRPHLRRGGRGHRDRLRGLPRHRARAIPTLAPRARPRGRAAPTCRSCARRTAAGASSGATGKLYQRAALDPDHGVGDDPGEGHRHARAIPSTTRRRRARS